MLAPQIRSMAVEVAQLEAKCRQQGDMIDACLDMHNDLMSWVADAEDERVAKEVLAIIERHQKRFPKSDEKSVFALSAPGGIDRSNAE